MAYSSNKRQFMIEMVGKYGELLNWSAISAEETDDEEFEKRQAEYFDFCTEKGTRPTLEAFCAACGISKKTYDYWRDGIIPVSERRKAAMDRLEGVLLALLTEWSLNGNVNPAIAIFNLKNNYGYKDEIEHTIRPGKPLIDKAKSNEEIEQLLAADAGENYIEVEYNEQQDH